MSTETQSPRAGDGNSADLIKAVEAYLEAQGALDNRELMGPNALPYDDLRRACNRAYESLDDALHAAKNGPVPPAYATEINRLRNVIQAACSGGLDHMIDRWKVLFPDAPVPTVKPAQLEDVEQYRLQMAGISTAALGYWKESDGILPDYDTLALRDVAKLYAKYDGLFKLREFVEDELFQIAGFLVGEGDAADLASRRIRAICARIEATRATAVQAPATGDAA